MANGQLSIYDQKRLNEQQQKGQQADQPNQSGQSGQSRQSRPRRGDTQYVVQTGDSWESIAGKLGSDQRKFQSLRSANNWDPSQVLQPGDVLKIPSWFGYKWKTDPYVSPTSAAYEGMSPTFDKRGDPTWDYSALGQNYKGPMGGSAASAYPSVTSLASPVGLGYTPVGFEDPKTVYQTWTWAQANPGKPIPGNVDPVQLKAAYDWFTYKNPGKTPDQWGYLSADDPGRAGLQKIGLPNQSDQVKAVPNLQAQPNGIDLSKAPAWQSSLFGFFSDPGAVPATIAGVLGGPAAAPGGYLLGTLGAAAEKAKTTGNIDFANLTPWEQGAIQAVRKLLGQDNSEVNWKTGDPVTLGVAGAADSVLKLMMSGMQNVEKGSGAVSQAIDYARSPDQWNKPFDWKAAADAGQLLYEAEGANMLRPLANAPAAVEWAAQRLAKGDSPQFNVALAALSNPAVAWGLERIARMFPDGNWKNEDLKFADIGQVWKMGNPNPVDVPGWDKSPGHRNNVNKLLASIREDMLQPGANPEQVVNQYRDVFGLSGQVADLAVQSIADPLRFLPQVESFAGAGLADLTGNKALSNVYLDSLKAGRGGLLEGRKQFTAEARTGQVGELTPFEKWITGISPDNKVAELNKQVATGNKLVDFANTMRQLTPRSKADAAIGLMRDHIFGSLLNRSQVDGVLDPGEFEKLYNARADFDYEAAANIADATTGGPEGYTIQPLLRSTKDYVGDQVKLWKTLNAPGGPREILYKVAGLLGMTPNEVLKSFRDKDATGLLDFQRLADRAAGGQSEGAKAISEMIKSGDFTPESLKTALQVYEQPGVPHSNEEWFGNLMTKLDDSYQKWLVDYYGLKTENAFFRSVKVAKSVMSMALLNSPSFFWRNVMNNQVTNFSETGSIMPNFQARDWLNRFGAIPSRLHEGFGMTGETNTGGDTGVLGYKQSGAIGQAEKGGADKLAPNANVLQKLGEGVLSTSEDVLGGLKSSPLGKYGLGVAQTASGAMEGLQGEQVFVHAMNDHYSHAWQPGVGFDRMSPAVEAAIERQVPGATKLIYDAIQNGVNASDLDALLKSQSIGQSMPGLLDAAARELGMPVDQMREMFAKTGILDDLQPRLENAKTPAEGLRAFDATQQRAQDYLDQMAASEYGAIAKDTEARVRLEGPAAAAEELANVQMGIADRWQSSMQTMSEMMNNLGNLTDPQRRAYIMATRLRDSNAWVRQNNFARSAFQGVFNAWGVEDGAARSALKLMLDSHTTWDAAFKERARMQDEFFANLFAKKANPMDWDMLTLKINLLFEKAFQSDLAIQNKVTGQLSDILSAKFGQPAGDVLKAGFKEVGDYRTGMWAAQKEHWAKVRTMEAPQRAEAWQQFNEQKSNWINEWRQRYTDAINKAMGFYKDGTPGAPVDPNAPSPTQPALLSQEVAQGVNQAADTNAAEILRVAVEHGLLVDKGQNVNDVVTEVLDTVKKYAGADGKPVRTIEDVTPQMAEKAFQNKEAKTAAQQQLETELQAQKDAAVASGAVEPPVVDPGQTTPGETAPAPAEQFRFLTPDQVRERQDAVVKVMAEHGMPTADADGQPIPGTKLDMLNIVRLYGPGDAYQTLRFTDITPEMARDAFENAARMAPENVDGMVRDIWKNDQGALTKPGVLTPEQQRQADVFEMLQSKPVSALPEVLRDPVRNILGDMLNQVRAGRKMSLLEWIKSKGGIDMQYLRDVTGEGKVQRAWGPGLFKNKGGLSLDELASRMEDEMYMTPGDMNNPSDNGGVNRAVELIGNELSGNKSFSYADESKSATLPGWYEGMKGLKNKQAKVALTIQQMLSGLDNVSGGAEATATERVIKNEVWRQLGDQATYDGNLAQATGHPYGWNEFKALLDDVQSQIPYADTQRLTDLIDTLDNVYMRTPQDIPAPIDELRQQVYSDLVTAQDKATLTTANDGMTSQIERATDKAKLHMSADYLREQLVTKFGYTPEAADMNVALAKARAQTWATLTGNSVDDWFTRSFSDILGKDQQSPDGDALAQNQQYRIGYIDKMPDFKTYGDWKNSLPLPEPDPIPQTGQYAAVLLDNGQLYTDTSPEHSTHVLFIERSGIPPERIQSGGWIVNGDYRPSDFSDTWRYARQKQAESRVLFRAMNDAREQGKPYSFNPDALYQQAGTQIAGATQFLPDQSAAIKAFEAADPSTFAHEFGHVLRRDLYRTFDETGLDWIKTDIDTLEQHFGVQNGTWDTPQEEAFARTWEKYLADGQAPNTGLKAVFEHFKAVMVQVYKSIVGSPIDVKMSDEVRGVFDRLISERDYGQANNPRYNPEAIYQDYISRMDKDIQAAKDYSQIPYYDVKVGNEHRAYSMDGELLASSSSDGLRTKLNRRQGQYSNVMGGTYVEAKPGDVIDRAFIEAKMRENATSQAEYNKNADTQRAQWEATAPQRETQQALDAQRSTKAQEAYRNLIAAKEGMQVENADGELYTVLKNTTSQTEATNAMVQSVGSEMMDYKNSSNRKNYVVFQKYEQLAPETITPAVNDTGTAGGMLPGMQDATGQLFDVQNTGKLNKMEAPNAHSIADVIPGKNAMDSTGSPLKVGDIVEVNGQRYNVKGTNRVGKIVTTDGKVLDPGDVTRIAQQNTLLQTQPEQPAQSPLETAPTLPLGGTDGVNGEPPMAQIYHEGFTKDLLPALDALRRAYEGGANKGFSLGDLSPENLDAFRKYLAQVKTQMPGVKLATMRYGEIKRDAAMLNYSRRRGIGKLLDVYAPYRFWTTESMGQWAQRAVDNPTWLSTYARLKQAGQMYQANEPDRLKGKIRIAIPGMPDWAGGGIYIDPTGVLFPYTNFTTAPLERMQQQAQNQNSGGEYKVRQWAADNTISAAEAKQALDTHAGATWERALAASLNEADAEQATPMDFLSTFMSPALYITAPLNAMGINIPGVSSGDKNDIGLTQAAKTAQNFQTAMSGSPLEGVGNLVGMLAKPEQWLRDKAGMSKLGTIGKLDLYSYYVNRQLAVMVSEGYPLKLAQVAMTEKQGPMYDEAAKRVAQEQTFKQDGMGALYLAAHGDFLDAVNPALLFSSGILSNGELEMRGDKQKFLDALKAKDAGDKTAISTFFAEHPEYSAKLNMTKSPDEMMKTFLSSEIWDKYNALNRYERKVTVEKLGTYFTNAFLNPETADPKSVNVDTLAMWAKVLNGYVPGSDKMPPTGITPETLQTQPAQMPDPSFSAAITAYMDERDKVDPEYYTHNQEYYALPAYSSAQKSYLLAHPDYAKYQTWNKTYKLQHPEVQLVNDMAARKVDMTQFNDLLKQQLSWYAVANVPLSTGGYAELKRVWENNGQPSGNLKIWLDTVIKPNMLMTPGQAQAQP